MNKASPTTTTLLTTSPAVRAYLRRATWGLPKERQQEVWDELEEHLLTRAEQFQLLGASPPGALARALAELGSPARVSAGMTQVYLMPKILIAAGAAALTLSAVLYAAAGGGSGPISLPALSSRPVTPRCATESKPSKPPTPLESAATCSLLTRPPPDAGAFVSLSDVKNAFATTDVASVFLPSGDLEVHYANGRNRLLEPEFRHNNQGYINATFLIISTVREPVTPKLELAGYNNPILTFGDLRLQLGTDNQPVKGNTFYRDLAPTLIGILTSPNLQAGWSARMASIGRNQAYPLPILSRHSIQTSLKAGEVVMSLIKYTDGSYFADVAQVNSKGRFIMNSDQPHIHFVSNLDQLRPYTADGIVPALLVRITNIPLRNLKSGIFVPAQANSDSQ
ncbi:HAAS signaling domain-containing protein [Deinococcus alpinitundrae]|uniref:HAAS signaling domain-containing protein n=1 Tax=Deinococcus alpinitundrae TaxID=468913 RepID=UPI00137A42DC|nr:permease prefix domain 1-containing protein [Deinococcus alpinitundrae]